MSEYFDRVAETLVKAGYEVVNDGNSYTIRKKYTQKYNVPKRVYSSGTLKKRLNAKHVEKLKETFVGYESCVTVKAESDKERVIDFADGVPEKEKVSGLVESMIAELHCCNSSSANELLHTLFGIKNEYDPRPTGVIFGHVE